MSFDVAIVCDTNNLKYRADHYIGVESGCNDLIAKGLPTQYAIGDFDHVSPTQWTAIKRHFKIIKSYSSCKDFIDGELAIKFALQQKWNKILLIADGRNRDLSLSAFYLVWNYQITWLNENNLVYLLEPGLNKINPHPDYKKISFVAASKAVISICYFRYNIQHLVLTPYSPLAMRNTFNCNQAQPGEVTVESGAVFVIWTK